MTVQPANVPMAGAGTTGDPAAAAARPFRVVALAASMGGVDALSVLLAALPADFPVPVLVLQHLSAAQPSRLAEILDGHCSLHVQPAVDGATILPGNVYVATPGQHLSVSSLGQLELGLSDAARVNFVCPSADVLFQSVAAGYGDAAIVVVLTGRGRDGAAGAEAVEEAGGCVMAQNRGTSQEFGMPAAAIFASGTTEVWALKDIAAALVARVAGGIHT